MKVVAQWFPARERGVAGGIYQIGASFGAVFAPPLVAWAVFHHSWRAAFFVAGGLGCSGCWPGCSGMRHPSGTGPCPTANAR